MSDAQSPPVFRMRAASLAAAALVVCGLVMIAVGLRFPLLRDDAREAAAVLSEVARAPAPRAEPAPPPREPPPLAEPAPASAPPPPPPASASSPSELVQIDTPHWLTRPRNPERYYPREAFMQGIEGRVELDCVVETDGQLQCVIASETPPSRGFGDAALALARAHTMRPAMLNGAPVRGRYRMVVPFSSGR